MVVTHQLTTNAISNSKPVIALDTLGMQFCKIGVQFELGLAFGNYTNKKGFIIQ